MNKVKVCYRGSAGASIERSYEAMLQFRNELQEVLASNDSLQENDIVVYMSFNCEELTTDMTLDECYVAVTGLTQKEQEEKARKAREEWKQAEAAHKASIPSKIEAFKEKAKPYIKEEDWDKLCEILPIRFGDIYHGMEMEAMLDIIKLYHETNDMDKCAELFYNQGHSGMGANLVRALVIRFHSAELGNYIYEHGLEYSK